MMKRRLLTFILLAVIAGLQPVTSNVHAAPSVQYGNTVGDVWDLQYRLKVLGYYAPSLDGQYGTQTKAAVAKFQLAYGVHADGIAGSLTWSLLRKHTLNLYEMDILAKIIYSEARGESYTGQVAVGAVVMNRIQSPDFPDTISEVVFQRGAFTAIDDGQYWLTPDRTAYLAAQDAVRGWDPSGGSLYYFNPNTATSSWIWSRTQNVKIGNHIFAN
ncbi:spore cortex-lytic enzyme [Paenibacillus apis]|uniref:Spore cortex-lytic enzyme n=2 Tax=Paenibacillus apis TaxID=1792174 RepID=A0A920CNE6_9BACL|nr:spore cortex-lytic enzyme [Paenibacillus apis]